MKFENPEYLALMYLHAGRYHLKKLLAKPYSEHRMRKLRAILPYQLVVDDDGVVGVVNRNYKPLGNLTPGWATYKNYMQFRLPDDKCRTDKEKESQFWFFNDGCPPWRDKKSAQEYLARLEQMFDFSTEDLEVRDA